MIQSATHLMLTKFNTLFLMLWSYYNICETSLWYHIQFIFLSISDNEIPNAWKWVLKSCRGDAYFYIHTDSIATVGV